MLKNWHTAARQMKADEGRRGRRGRSRQIEADGGRDSVLLPRALSLFAVLATKHKPQKNIRPRELVVLELYPCTVVRVPARQRAGVCTRIGACGHGMRVCMPAQQHTNTKDSNNTTIMILYNKITSTTSNKITKITSTTSNIPTSSFLFLWLFLLWCSVLAGLCPCCFL